MEPEYTSGNILSRDDILNYDIGAPIPVEAFGGTVHVRPLSGEERDRYEMQNLEQRKNGTTRLNLVNARARLVQLCLVERDQNGKWVRMFTRNDIDKLGRLPAAELDKIADVAREASGLDSDDEDQVVESFGEETPAAVGAGSY